MEKMINDYLAFAGDLEKEKSENVKIKFFLRNIITYYKKIHHEINYQFNFSDNLELNIKPNYLKRAIRNLIDNGFKYGKKVEITTSISNKILKIIIDDDGPGIPEAERENVFKPFYRLDNSRNLDSSSTGLGLAIVLDSITSHGGRIETISSPMGGLRVIINLPI
jgi:two-component system osmolarity sensor histidine kinase EnvZ